MEIKDFKVINKDTSPLKATFSVLFPVTNWGDFNVNMKYFEKTDGSSWIAYPQESYTNAEGEKKYKNLAYFDKQVRQAFEAFLIPKVKAMMQEKKTAQVDFTAKEAFFSNENLPF